MKYLYNYSILAIFCGILLTQCTTPKTDIADQLSENEIENPDEVFISKEQFEKSDFKLGIIEERTFDQIVEAPGVIEVPEKNKAVVSSYIGGTVGPMKLILGQWVSKGQVLFQLTNPDLIDMQKDYLEAKAQLKYLQVEYERQKVLSNENISAKKDYLLVESQLNRIKATMAALGEKLKLIGISPDMVSSEKLISTLPVVAPIGGYIEMLAIVEGSYLSATTPAVEIINTHHMHLELHVLESDYAKVKKDQNIIFYNQSDPSKEHNASVHLINKMLDENHFVNVHCHIEDSALKELAPGMYIDSHIIIDKVSAMTLPQEAIVSMDNNHYVLMLRDMNNGKYTFEKKLVKVGNSNEGYTEILNTENLPQHGQYLIKGAYNVIL